MEKCYINVLFKCSLSDIIPPFDLTRNSPFLLTPLPPPPANLILRKQHIQPATACTPKDYHKEVNTDTHTHKLKAQPKGSQLLCFAAAVSIYNRECDSYNRSLCVRCALRLCNFDHEFNHLNVHTAHKTFRDKVYNAETSICFEGAKSALSSIHST